MRAALVVGLVLLAGCSGWGGFTADPATETPTLTPVSVPESAPGTTPTSTQAASVAPGIGPEGVRDPFAISTSHTLHLSNRSFQLVDALTVRNASGTLRYHRNRSVAVEGSEFFIEERIGGPRAQRIRQPPGTFELYSDGEQFRSRLRFGNDTSYSRADGDIYLQQREVYNPPPYQGRLFALFAIPDSWTVRTDPLRLTGRATASDPGPLGPGVEARNLTVEATVDRRVVTEWSVRYETVVDGDAVVVHRRVRYLDVGETSVSRPAWYEAAG